jgi:hypothetical protein
MLMPDFYGKVVLFQFQSIRRNFRKKWEKRVDFCDRSRKLPLNGVIFREGNMFSLLKGQIY